MDQARKERIPWADQQFALCRAAIGTVRPTPANGRLAPSTIRREPLICSRGGESCPRPYCLNLMEREC
jgi:hypothetical protein